jgi:hypothetical protein
MIGRISALFPLGKKRKVGLCGASLRSGPACGVAPSAPSNPLRPTAHSPREDARAKAPRPALRAGRPSQPNPHKFQK